MDIKRKTCDIWNRKKTFISRHILHQHWYTCPIALPVRRNPQHRSLLTIVSPISEPPFQTLRHQRNVCHPVVNRFTRQTLSAVNRKYFIMNILCNEPLCTQKPQHRPATRYYTHPARSPFWLLKPASEHAHARLLPRPAWSWTVLLTSDTYIKPITSITGVLLQFVTYLLTLLLTYFLL
jgi:hypothetical protein